MKTYRGNRGIALPIRNLWAVVNITPSAAVPPGRGPGAHCAAEINSVILSWIAGRGTGDIREGRSAGGGLAGSHRGGLGVV